MKCFCIWKSDLGVLKNIDVSETAQQQRVLEIIGDGVFKNLAMRVVLDSEPEQDTDVAVFLERLRQIPNLHFLTITTSSKHVPGKL